MDACHVSIRSPRVDGFKSMEIRERDLERLQVYEDLVNQDYDPFHHKCGNNVVFSAKRGIIATRGTGYGEGMVFSAKPIPVGTMFGVKLLEKEDRWSGSLAIGFTLLDPDTIDSIPKFGTDLISEDYWLFLNSIVYHDEQEQDINISTLALNEGDSIGWCITRDGDWEIYINGKKRGVGWHNVPTDKPIWGVVEMYGKAITIQSEFCYELLNISREVQFNVRTLEERFTPLEATILKDGENQSVQLQLQNQVEILQLKQQNQQQASQIEHLQHMQQEHTSQLEKLQEELTAHFQQQLEEQKRQIEEEMQKQFQAQLVQLQSRMQNLQPSWSIDQEHLEITERVLGRGAYGEVRVGIYQGTRVAVKRIHGVIISDYNRELFEREMNIASLVCHPNLVLFIGAVATGNPNIISELMETSLRKVMEAKKLKVTDIRPISKDVACALVYLHSLPDPFVHRGISSANVLLNAKKHGWQTKLGDFGSANFLAKLGTVAPGCVAYAAPEAFDHRQQSPKMDVYTFGVLLLEVCVGKFMDPHTLESTKVAMVTWSDPSKKSLGEWSKRCMKRDPNERPNMADFVRQF